MATTTITRAAQQPPPTVEYDDVTIPYQRLVDGYSKEWPPRQPLPVPEFQADANPDDVVTALKKSGGVFVRNVLTPEEVQQIESDLRPSLEADKPWAANDGFFPPTTRRAFGLVGKSRLFAEKVVNHPVYQAVCDQFLTTKAYKWHGNRSEVNISRPQLNNTIAFSVRPGGSNQPLHRDDDIHYASRERVHEYPKATNSRELGIGFFVAGKKSTKANGATRFIPGSHLEATEQPPQEEFVAYAELSPGDGFIMLSSCYHGGSANTTNDEERLLFSCFMTRGYLRYDICSPLFTIAVYSHPCPGKKSKFNHERIRANTCEIEN
ncbi:hypothetical protein AYO21_03565 [Fonsecaea monophora]|uniref:Phytanoyl-CoA dioxygenase family protein n=1 Tax=Fonsecaea monophora TaxID=254056 RepID=A0A177FEC2_9EURO|nr:hypothetical protein AYO21_03565 [Fonsecaea monophora]KAH0848074.1 phytanoyl-CoA dioxygenase family protein [Fonsecaea pedrosoi]OAG42111.1 hypothetical protein AYO21_03565 [Fonsecaea monophora]